MPVRSRFRRVGLSALAVAGALAVVLSLMAVLGHEATSHAAAPARIGLSSSTAAMQAQLDEPGILELQTVHAADWEVPLAGLLDLGHPKARAAGLTDRPEPIVIDFHAIRHPTHGLFIVDSGVERALKADPDQALVGPVVRRLMNEDAMVVHTDTATWLAEQDEPLAGVFLTHLHLDHIMGLPDIEPGTPVYVGPGETEQHALMHFATASVVDRALEGLTLRELTFEPDPTGRFAGVVDIFGDGSLWAIHVPGHTAGSVAFVARTTDGPVLLTGDASHTRWGWEHDVGPGDFSADPTRGFESFQRLRALAKAHPTLDVRVGHKR